MPTAEANPERGPGLDRLVFFSDGVFAIAITLLALDIRLPEVSGELTDAGLLDQLVELGPKYFSFVISFVAIGFYWIAHHRNLQLVVRSDVGLLLLNLLLLMGVAFVPFPTAVIGDYDNRTANTFYALVLAVVGLLNALIWLYASVGGRLLARELDRRWFLTSLVRTFLAPVCFGLSAVVAVWAPAPARILWYVIAAVELVIVVFDGRGRTWPTT